MKQEHKTGNEAVSPVVGVMLMLVVTIIIAAVAGAFAGNLSGNAEKAPSAAIDVKITSNGGESGNEYVMTFEHLGGDPIPTKDLKILTFYTEPGGLPHSNEITPLVRGRDIFGDGKKVKIPFLNDVSKGSPGDPEVDFGSFTFMSGDILSSGTTIGTGSNYGAGILGFDIINDEYGFGEGSPVEVKLIHLPSGKEIYSKEVIVQ
ncbi:type IV pilin [Methanofollis formosanus]|uniref:Type IV pilin n=1 Tax=Methanofollis formosanus TaxID=299308 RepID=A0A8G1A3D8_9EURY|nr:type IV pilin N-terminal domain-containing protein [Methanofollis formosanus]QYZ80330.1 type IV pilin [Methanofollis formosanus]